MKNLIELRKKAEQAVDDMPEGDLKLKAFETILAHLLSGDAVGDVQHVNPSKKKTAAAAKEDSPQVLKSFEDRVLSLKTDEFFSEQRSIADIRMELKKNGWHYPVTSMSGPLQRLVQKKALRRERANDAEGRKGWKYSNP